MAVDSSADGAADGLDDLFSMDAEGENGAELEESGDDALDTAPAAEDMTTLDTPDLPDIPDTANPEQPAAKPVDSADTAAPSVGSPAAEPQTTTVTDAQPVETVGIVSSVDSDADTLTVISGDVDGKVAEVTLFNTEVVGVVDVAAAQYADTYGSQLPTISASRPNRAPTASTAGATTPVETSDFHDFTNDITSAKLQYRGSQWENWSDITADSYIDEYAEINALLDYTLPAGTLSDTKNTIKYTLPDALKNFKEAGYVRDTSSGKTIGVGKIENGVVSITFYDAYVEMNAKGSPIYGSVAFDGKASEMEITYDQETTIKFNESHSSTIIIKKDSKTYGDLHTQKSIIDSDLANGTVKYTVKVWSTYGTAGHPVTLDDIMTNIQLDTTKGITVTKNTSTSVDSSSLTYTPGNKGFTGTLPALGEDEYYELTYWGMLPSDLKGGNVTTTNQIHVESTNSKGEKIDSDSSVNFNFNTVKKTGVKNDDDTISWTVTLNENHAEMKGWTLSDELNGSDYKGTVHFETSTGASFDDALPYKFGTNSADTDTTASYTITYKTPGDHDYNTSQVKNKVTLKDDHDNEKGSSEYDVEVGSKDAYFKDGKGVIENTDGTLTLNWHIKLIIDKDYAAGWKWYDQASCYNAQYFTPKQRQDLYAELDRVLNGHYYEVSDAYGNKKTDNYTGTWDTIGIIGTKPLTKGTVLEFDFSTTIKRPDKKTDFKNQCYFNSTAFDGTNTYRPNGNAIVKKYDKATGKTAKSILISCGARLAPFDIQEVRDATMYDELELDKLGDRKTALFLIMSDTDSTFNFLISMIYTQLFNLLCDKADDQYGGKLPVHVRCLIDECANIGQIPQLEKLVATIRSREISACLVLQTRSQLKAIYKDNADTIVGNMDSQIFLGGSEPTTLKDLAEALGKETIDSYNNSDTRGNSPSYGTNYQKLGHELMSRDELAVLDGGKCILQLRGVRPFLSDKYDLTQHPNYKYTSDYDPKNALDIEKFLNRKEKIHPDDTFVMVDVDSLPPA